MSVYTPLSHDQIENFLKPYSLGALISYKGISSGVENSNYFVTLKDTTGKECEYVLTLFEHLNADDLPFYVQLTSYLYQQGCVVPCAIADKSGTQIKMLANKPALIVPKAEGAHCERPTLIQCEKIGTALAGVHLASKNFQPLPKNPRALPWLQQSANSLQALLNEREANLLNKTLQTLDGFFATKPTLPRGIIHADLFRDNVLFANGEVSALIDFYNACFDDWLYDVAITANDWCSTEDGGLDVKRTEALLKHYQAVRPFTDEEEACWSAYLLMAACRFWVSRLLDWHHPDKGAANKTEQDKESLHPVTMKDPAEFERIVADRLVRFTGA